MPLSVVKWHKRLFLRGGGGGGGIRKLSFRDVEIIERLTLNHNPQNHFSSSDELS